MASSKQRILLCLIASSTLLIAYPLFGQFQPGDLVVEAQPGCIFLACNNFLLVFGPDGSFKSQTQLFSSRLDAGSSGGSVADNRGTLYWTDGQAIYRVGSDGSLQVLSAPPLPFCCYYSLVASATGNLYAASSNGTVTRFGADGGYLGVTGVASAGSLFHAIDLINQCTLIYSSAIGTGNATGRFNLCTAQPLSPLTSSLPKPPLAFRARRDGSILVATFGDLIAPAYLVDASGVIERTYGDADALALDRDGHSFWSGESNRIQKVDIDTGAVSTTITLPGSFSVVSMAVIGEPRAATDATQIPAFSTIGLAFLALILAVTGLMRNG